MPAFFTIEVAAIYPSLVDVVTFCDRHSGFVMAVLTATYVVATILLVAFARKQVRLTFELERSRVRPLIVLDLVIEHSIVHVSLKNHGQTLAQNIKIDVQPEIRTLYGGTFEGVYIDPPEERDEAIAFLANGVSSLAPGRELKTDIGYVLRFESHYSDREFKGVISYTGSDGFPYRERFVVDLASQLGLLHIQRHDVHDVVEELKRLRTEISKIARKIGANE